jgi:hypothetical protein
LIKILLSKYFKYLSGFFTLGNSIALAMRDYSDRENKTEWNIILDHANEFCSVFFALEVTARMIGYSINVFKPNTFFRDAWNCLDFLIVIFGLAELGLTVQSVPGLRLLRFIRPLRIVRFVPSKIYVSLTHNRDEKAR